MHCLIYKFIFRIAISMFVHYFLLLCFNFKPFKKFLFHQYQIISINDIILYSSILMSVNKSSLTRSLQESFCCTQFFCSVWILIIIKKSLYSNII
ncbi:hypothetical protein L9F63_004562, partial [Diploptera punctata]